MKSGRCVDEQGSGRTTGEASAGLFFSLASQVDDKKRAVVEWTYKIGRAVFSQGFWSHGGCGDWLKPLAWELRMERRIAGGWVEGGDASQAGGETKGEQRFWKGDEPQAAREKGQGQGNMPPSDAFRGGCSSVKREAV